MMDGDLHFRVASNKLNPELYRYVDKARLEFDYGWQIDAPICDGKNFNKKSPPHRLATLEGTLPGRKADKIFRLDRG